MKHIRKSTTFSLIASFLLSLALMGQARAWAEEFERISPEVLKEMIVNGEEGVIVVDVQPEGVYAAGHIKGAVSLPWEQNLKSAPNLPKDKLLVLYCDCTHEEDSISMSVQLMEKWDYTNIKLLDGGWSGWIKLGYPVEGK